MGSLREAGAVNTCARAVFCRLWGLLPSVHAGHCISDQWTAGLLTKAVLSSAHKEVLYELLRLQELSFPMFFSFCVFKLSIQRNEFPYDRSKPSRFLTLPRSPARLMPLLSTCFSAFSQCFSSLGLRMAVAALEFFDIILKLQTSRSHLELESLTLESAFLARHTFTPSTGEVEAGRFLWVPAQPGLHSDTTSWTTPAP